MSPTYPPELVVMSRIARGLAALGAAVLVVGGATLLSAPAGATVSTSLAVLKNFRVDLRGNGHGHGMSQYGAQGAAEQGLGYRRILHFYYPGTRIRSLPARDVRVLISRHTGGPIVIAAQRGLHVDGIAGTLPTAGVRRYKFVAGRRAGIGLYALRGGQWHKVRYGLPATTRIHRHGPVRVFLGDGSSTAYRQNVLAVRRTPHGATGLLAVNRVSIDDYVAGVVPREMPASWDAAALKAQAVAARTYALYSMLHSSSSSAYDICDTSNCQVYGGAVHYYPDGSVAWTDDQAALTGDENQYLYYRGAPILAQFSASNGGWTADGGELYLPAQADPYDTAAIDPYALYHETISSSSVASYFGLAKLTGITIVKRDGHGAWGGRVVTAQVTGRDAAGASTTVTTDGPDLQWAMGVGTDWLRLTPDHEPRGQLGSVRRHRSRVWVTGWAVDTDHASHSPRVRVRIDGRIAATFHTHRRRPRLVRHFALRYRKPGFHRWYHPSAGRHRVCVSVLDSDGLPPTHLGCRAVRVRRSA